jgi:transposase
VGDACGSAIKQGESDPQVLAELAKGRLREKLPALRLALTGRVQAHHRQLIGELLDHIDYLEQAMQRVEANIAAQVSQEDKAVQLLLTLPATGPVTAAAILAEIGTDMSRFRKSPTISLRGLGSARATSAAQANSSAGRLPKATNNSRLSCARSPPPSPARQEHIYMRSISASRADEASRVP